MKAYITIKKTNTKFGNIGIKKQKFHQYKRPISTKNVDISKTVVANKVSFGKKCFKYFISYKDAKRVRPLWIFIPKMIACTRDFEETKYVLFW